MNKEILIIDHDDTISNFIPELLDWYNWDADDNLTVENITDWELSKFVKPEYKEQIYKYLEDPNISKKIFLEKTKPQPYAVEVTQWLQKYFDIWIVSATHPYNVKYKVQWLEQYFPHIDIKKRYCVHPDKTLFKANWIIDDNYNNIKSFKHGILFTRNWNQKYNHNPRVNNWLEVRSYFEQLIDLGIIKMEGVA